MKCRRVKKLLPLYVEEDLSSDRAEQISAHLEWCGQCNWLADEYKESQTWLQTNEAPEFDQAFLDNFKSGVMRRLEETAARPSLLVSIAQHWSRRQMLAMSGAMLIAIGVVVLYLYQTRVDVKAPIVEIAKQTTQTQETPLDPRMTVDHSQEHPSVPSKHSTYHSNQKAHKAEPMADSQEPPLFSQVNRWVELGTPNEMAITPKDGTTDFPEMLRIDIQTADPNIRIIWFTPKVTDGPHTDQ
jgi:putative zinc finger protein